MVSKLALLSSLDTIFRQSLLRFWRSALLVLIIMACSLSMGAGNSEQSFKQPEPAKTTLKVAMDDNYPPYIFRDSNGVLTGYLVDIWKLWETKTHVPVELVATDWNVAQENMSLGRVDAIDTIFQIPERDKVLDFTPSYVDIPVSIYAHKDIGGITSLKTLKGFLVGVKEGDACIQKLQEAGIRTLVEYTSYKALIEGSINGVTKIFCLDEPPANYLLYRASADGEFHKAFQLYTGAFHRAVHKGDISTLHLLESGFAAITPSEQKALHNKWMGTPLIATTYRRYLAYGLLIIGLLFGVLTIWGMALRRLVQLRTKELNEERMQLRTLIQTIPDLIWLKDKKGIYRACNPRFEQFFGNQEKNIVGKTDYDFVDKKLADFFRENDQKAMDAAGPTSNEEWLTFSHDQSHGLFETIKTPMYDEKGEITGVLGIARDITLHHQTKQQLQNSENFFQTLAAVNPVGIFRTDAQQRIIFVNQCWSTITGISSDRALNQLWYIGIFNDDLDMAVSEWANATNEQHTFSLEFRIEQPNKSILWVMGNAVATKDETGNVSGYVGTITDITGRKTSEDEIKHLAFYDPLTNLPNRRLLYERLQQAIKTANRNACMGAVLFIDLDDFKTINDTSGHETGDILLQLVAPILVDCVRDADTVSRLGGDEFVILLEGLSENILEAANQAKLIARKILSAISKTYLLGDKEHHTTGSIGITMFGHLEISADELLKQADLAMYQAKLAGRNTMRFFDVEMQSIATKRANLESDIRKGINEAQFLLHYQPQLDKDGHVFGAESLVRWQHPSKGMIFPLEFISIMEETGLIIPLGTWVLKAACQQLVAWEGRTKTEQLLLAVNVSSKQFRQVDFVDQVLEILTETGANPNKLKLELTESLLLDNVEEVILKMQTLKLHGIGFSLDDFGTGYSSLSYLKRLPLDQLKIDRSFIRDVLVDPDDAVIAKAIISLGNNLGLSVIAEGVETQEQCHFLQEHGCFEYQGYLFSKPLALAEFEHFLQTRTS